MNKFENEELIVTIEASSDQTSLQTTFGENLVHSRSVCMISLLVWCGCSTDEAAAAAPAPLPEAEEEDEAGDAERSHDEKCYQISDGQR